MGSGSSGLKWPSWGERALGAEVIWESSLEEGDQRSAGKEGVESQKTVEVDNMGCTGGNRQVCSKVCVQTHQEADGQKDWGRGLAWGQISGGHESQR